MSFPIDDFIPLLSSLAIVVSNVDAGKDKKIAFTNNDLKKLPIKKGIYLCIIIYITNFSILCFNAAQKAETELLLTRYLFI